MATNTADEAKVQYISKMGPELGQVYHHLWQEIAYVHQKWEEYVELFGTKASRIDLLNDAAPRFFRLIEDSLWESILLHIARIVDPPVSAGKQTLSIRGLPPLVHGSILDKLTSCVAAARVSCEFCRDWRNRRIAHNDLDLITNPTATPLTPASRRDVNAALKSLVAVLDVVSEHYTGSTNMFEWKGGGAARGAVALLQVLQAGVRADQELRARWNRGDFDARDLHRRDDI